MSTNFYFKSIRFENYRGLNSLVIPMFRRLNLIGGYNGSGKSTLLEALFLILDRRGPLALTRPFMWRKLGMNGKGSLDQLFFKLETDKEILISSQTASGLLDLTICFQSTPQGVAVRMPAGPAVGAAEMQSMSTDIGLNVQAKLNGKEDDAIFALPMPDGLSFTPYKIGVSRIPIGALVSPSTRNAPQDDANRFSEIIKQNRLRELLDVLSIVRPSVSNIQLLQEGTAAVLYAQMDDGALYPFPMLGDGVQTVLSIALAIMNLPGGVLLLDEFDSAIHYSILSDVWGKIAVLADKYNCQVFAVTHSRECIKAAVDGVGQVQRQVDLQYIRLERNENGNSAVCYDSADLSESVNANWEVR